MIQPEHKVEPVAGERATYMVTGRTLYCRGECAFTHTPGPVPKHAAGDPCPRCGQPLAPLQYRVELAAYSGLGMCGCPRWQFHFGPMVSRMTPLACFAAARLGDDLRCPHVVAALRAYAVEMLQGELSAAAEFAARMAQTARDGGER